MLRSQMNLPETVMKVIAVAAAKGGVGRTTLSAHLGVELTRRGYKTLLVDSDPQASLQAWWEHREADEPALMVASDDELDDIRLGITRPDFDFVIIDTAAELERPVRLAIDLATLVVIPTTPSPLDLRSIRKILHLVVERRKPTVLVLNRAHRRTYREGESLAFMAQHGRIAPTLYDHQDFVTAMVDGRAAQELNSSGRAAQEIAAMCDYLIEQMESIAAALYLKALACRTAEVGQPLPPELWDALTELRRKQSSTS